MSPRGGRRPGAGRPVSTARSAAAGAIMKQVTYAPDEWEVVAPVAGPDFQGWIRGLSLRAATPLKPGWHRGADGEQVAVVGRFTLKAWKTDGPWYYRWCVNLDGIGVAGNVAGLLSNRDSCKKMPDAKAAAEAWLRKLLAETPGTSPRAPTLGAP
jgi:hypothetical protein